MVLMGSAESGVSCAVDTSTHEIVAVELSLSNVTDAEVLPNLLNVKSLKYKVMALMTQGIAMMLYN